MSLFLDILGVIAFLAVMFGLLRRRLVWLFRRAYEIARVEKHNDAGIQVTIVARNGSNGTRTMNALSLRAFDEASAIYEQSWRWALFGPEDARNSTLVFPEGDSIHHVQMRLLSTDIERIFDSNRIRKLEENISLRIAGGTCRLELKMETSEGIVKFHGHSASVPVAREKLTLRRRLLRTF